MRILGIDPGSRATGYGIVERNGHQISHVVHGTLRPPRGGEAAGRLAALLAELGEVVRTHAPDVAVVERVFLASNPSSALVLGQARGVALAAAATGGLPVREYTASQIKRAVTGHGGAAKTQVQWMVQELLGLTARPAAAAAAALAAALCHGHTGRLADLVADGARGAPRGRGQRPRSGGRVVVRRAR